MTEPPTAEMMDHFVKSLSTYGVDMI